MHELIGIEEQTQQSWTKALRELLLEEGDRLNREESTVSKRGWPKRSAARNLLTRLFHQNQILAFSDNFAVPFDTVKHNTRAIAS